MVFKVSKAAQPAEKVAPLVLSSWNPDWSQLYLMIRGQFQNINNEILDSWDAGASPFRDLTTEGNHTRNVVHVQAEVPSSQEKCQ